MSVDYTIPKDEIRAGQFEIDGDVFVRVIRCRDCMHYRDHEFILVTDVSDVCTFFADGVKVEPDGFCAWGEKR